MDVFPLSFLLHDWRMVSPSGLDDARSLITGKFSDAVPVIRLYGYACPLGLPKSAAKSCVVNVHRYFPKLFMDVLPGLSAAELAELIDSRLGGSGEAIVYNIWAEERTNFYGYHESPTSVFAVQLFRPLDVARLAEFASSELRVKVYEVHIPYMLQFLIEHSIQGVTPFWIDPGKIVPTKSVVPGGLEISITPEAVIVQRATASDSQAGRDYPVPPALSGSSNQDLVCEVLQSLWKEEFMRTSHGEAFPYQPEGVLDGIDRPDCAEMPWATARRSRLCEWADCLRRQEKKEKAIEVEQEGVLSASTSLVSSIASTGRLARGLADLLDEPCYDMSLGEDDSRMITPTVVNTLSTLQQTVSTFEEQPSIDAIASSLPPAAAEKEKQIKFLPNTACVIKFVSIKAPLPVAVTRESQLSRFSLSGTQPVPGPQRIGKPIPSTQELSSDLTFLTMVVIEILTATDALVPDASRDAVLAVAVKSIDERVDSSDDVHLIFFWSSEDENISAGFPLSNNTELVPCASEQDMYLKLRKRVFDRVDPHVVLSWDVSRSTLGYMAERMHFLKLEIFFGRCKPPHSGRLHIDLWKVLRNDAESGLKLGTTTLEGVAHSVLGITVASLPDRVLKNHFLKYQKLLQKVFIVSQLADKTRVMPRATEMARLYGMDLESTFTRGSQFRVECMLVRASRRSGFLLPSSSKKEVRGQVATEGIPMVLEPVSGFITDPVCVFDFQSLYPSLIIAHNMCFSTCLGRISDSRNVVHLGTQTGFLRTARAADQAICVPSEVAFVHRSARVGLLPRICHEILQTRLMVKKSMKSSSSKSHALLKQLDARQLSLKLLANVIYGYTTASFSGRMPCAEIADAIVLTARDALEHVMRLAEAMGGVIVYGDTDSLFVRLGGGKNLNQAFEFGEKLVKKVSETFPWPMKLIHEKVYWPCCLVTKKRYVGRAFDTVHASPRLDAKGIETIRRDTCPAVAVTVERIINEMFDLRERDDLTTTKSIGRLEAVCIKEFSRILRGALPLKFFVFQNQVRQLADYKDMQHLPPAARVAVDSGRNDTCRGERIAYIITHGEIGSKLSEQVKPPSALANKAQLNLEYYVTKQVIPAVQRIFGPLADRAFTWLSHSTGTRKNNPSFAVVRTCLLCSAPTASSLFKTAKNVPLFCAVCMQTRTAQTIATAGKFLNNSEKRIHDLRKLCMHCAGTAADACTDAYHCEVYFQKIRSSNVDRSRYSCSSTSSWYFFFCAPICIFLSRMFSGPVLAVAHSDLHSGRLYCGSGPFLRTINSDDATCDSEQILSDSVSIHGISEINNRLVVFGGREIWLRSTNGMESKRVKSQDWVLAATVWKEYLIAAVMHNRIEVYDLAGEEPRLVRTVACPEHALLYSAAIVVSGSSVEIFGGGVMSSVYHWLVSLEVFRVESYRLYQEHKGSVFRIRLNKSGDSLLTTSDDRTAIMWTRARDFSFSVSKTFSGHLARVWDAIWIDSGAIATACEDGIVRIFTDREVIHKQGHEKDVRCLSFDKSLVSGGEDGCVREWSLKAETVLKWTMPSGLSTNRFDKSDWIRNVNFQTDKKLAVVTNFGRIFEIDSDSMVATGPPLRIENSQEISCSDVCAESVFLGTVDGSVVLMSNGKVAATMSRIVPHRVVSIFALSERLAFAANHTGDILKVSFDSLHEPRVERFRFNRACTGKLLCHAVFHNTHFFGDEKGYVNTFGTSFRVSGSDKITSLETNHEEFSGLIANTSRGRSFSVSLEGEVRALSNLFSPPANYLLRSATSEKSLSVGFGSTGFIVADEQGVQWVHDCGGHRRPFDFRVEKQQFVFVHATNDTVFRAVSRPSCRVLHAGYNGDLIHEIIPIDNHRCLTMNEDNKIRLIDPFVGETARVVGSHEGSIRAGCAVGGLMLCGGARSQLSLWSLSDLKLIEKLSLSNSDDDIRVMALAGMTQGSHSVVFLAGDSTARVHIISVKDSSIIETRICDSLGEIEKSVILSAACCGQLFFVGAGNGTVVCLDKEGHKLSSLRAHQSGVNAISATEGFIVSASDDQSLSVSKAPPNGQAINRVFHLPNASSCSIRAITCTGWTIHTTGTDRKISEWIMKSSGELELKSRRSIAVTDPLALCLLGTSLIVGGRGLQTLPLE